MAPFRFTLQCSSTVDPDEFRACARRAEGLGYDALTIADHFDDQLAPVPALMAAADVTTTLRLGWLVLCNDYRHPVVAAKEAATIDRLSGGRLLVGLGAGWMATDYERAGIVMDRPGVRIERLAEAVTVMKGLFTDGPVDFDGEHYTITGLEGLPKPTQRPHPPIIIGGGGRRILELAAREADIVALNVNLAGGAIDERAYPNGTADATDEKVGWVRATAGDRIDQMAIQTRIHLALVSESADALIDDLAPQFGLTPTEARATPHALVGGVDELCDQLVERRERWGISMIGLSADVIDDLAPVVARLAGT
ncbi:MAG TPA: TIGR03621 family F420-dependent LLM class oxidoreductase [Acidimicrobiales bacterium]|nr:TIGR03621 family F420-dependent LLM class oxidoreductase [Acidimicrobiales bacterium]